MSSLEQRYIEELVRDSVQRKKMFQALDKETRIKVDFHVDEMIEGELSRSLLK